VEDAGTHSKLGELIGESVRQATLEALSWQNRLERSSTRSIKGALGRFGLTEKELHARLQLLLPKASHELKQNEMSVTYEPRVAVALSSKPAMWADYWSRILARSNDRLEPFVTALALGWQALVRREAAIDHTSRSSANDVQWLSKVEKLRSGYRLLAR
jgi:hypothetical protein